MLNQKTLKFRYLKMPDKRFISSLVLAAILLATVFFFPPPLVCLVIACLTGQGLWEFYSLTENKGYKPFKFYGTSLGILLSVMAYFIVSSHIEWNEFLETILFIMLASILIKYAFVRDGSSVILNSSITILGILYVSFLFVFIIKVRYTPDASAGKGWVMALFITTKISDISAYICGTRWGKHKLIPRISAKKTIEGTIFGVIGAILASLVCKLWFLEGLNWIETICLGFLLSLAGQIGDLVESLIKRDAQVKDSGKLVPGMGGVLDFMDSLLFAGPVMYFYLTILL